MPERHSSPPRPSATVSATSASQSCPASTCSTTLVASRATTWCPRVSTSNAVPAKPASPTTRLEPPPTSRSGSFAPSAARVAATTSSAVLACTSRRAGPPRPSVVWGARRVNGSTVSVLAPAACADGVGVVGAVGPCATAPDGNLRRVPRRIAHRATWDASAQDVYTVLVDEDHLKARLAELGGNDPALLEHTVDASGARLRLRHSVPVEFLPSAIRRFTGDDLVLDRVETWRPRDGGGYDGTFEVTVRGLPGSLSGSQRLGDDGDGSVTEVDGEAAVSVPMV